MDPIAKTDAELVADTLAGDREAFGQLYDRHARMVRGVILAVACDWSAVEDMTQECFLRAYRKLDTLRERDRFGAWLAGFARQLGRERRRTNRRDRHVFGANTNQFVENAQPERIDPAQIEQVLDRLAMLPEDERLAIHAHFFTDQNASAAAAQLDISRSSYYALLQRALARLATRSLPLKPKNEATA